MRVWWRWRYSTARNDALRGVPPSQMKSPEAKYAVGRPLRWRHMSMTSQITDNSIICSDQEKRNIIALRYSPFMNEIHRWLLNSFHKGLKYVSISWRYHATDQELVFRRSQLNRKVTQNIVRSLPFWKMSKLQHPKRRWWICIMYFINRSRPSDAYMRHWIRLSVIQIMACSPPSHYLNQCWFIVNWTLRNKFKWNYNLDLNIVIQENSFWYIISKMSAIFL